MLMVIFGAGATYDSAANYPASSGPGLIPRKERPPLTDSLFDNREAFRPAQTNFPEFTPIAPELIYRGVAVEKALRRLLDQAATYPQLFPQIAAVRYYLQSIIAESTNHWYTNRAQHASNHLSLLHQIRQALHRSARREPVCLVTFNYDLLIERALGREFVSIDDYIKDDTFKLFKLHGSVNWARKVVSEDAPQAVRDNPIELARCAISSAASIKLADEYNIVAAAPPPCVDDKMLYPAIAIPVDQKSEFECPAQHLQLLTELIPKVTGVLIIGWRAGETKFLDLLRSQMRTPAKVVACCGNVRDATATLDALRTLGKFSDLTPLEVGFTEMIADRMLDAFLLAATQ